MCGHVVYEFRSKQLQQQTAFFEMMSILNGIPESTVLVVFELVKKLQ